MHTRPEIGSLTPLPRRELDVLGEEMQHPVRRVMRRLFEKAPDPTRQASVPSAPPLSLTTGYSQTSPPPHVCDEGVWEGLNVTEFLQVSLAERRKKYCMVYNRIRYWIPQRCERIVATTQCGQEKLLVSAHLHWNRLGSVARAAVVKLVISCTHLRQRQWKNSSARSGSVHPR